MILYKDKSTYKVTPTGSTFIGITYNNDIW